VTSMQCGIAHMHK